MDQAAEHAAARMTTARTAVTTGRSAAAEVDAGQKRAQARAAGALLAATDHGRGCRRAPCRRTRRGGGSRGSVA